MTEPRCLDCEAEMEAGFLPDGVGPGFSLLFWQRGKPQEKHLFGLPAGFEVDTETGIDVTAYRCPKCGVLRLYANQT